MSEQKSKNPLQKLKEKFDDKEEQLEVLGTFIRLGVMVWACLLYTSDAADE